MLAGSPLWRWLGDRDLIPPYALPRLSGVRFRWRDDIRRVPAVGAAVAALRLRGRSAPVELDFRSWAAAHVGEEAADTLARSSGILTYYHDPGALSAAFLWEPMVRGMLAAPPTARYPIGGWSAIVDRLAERAGALGVRIETGARAEQLPEPPVIVATELARTPATCSATTRARAVLAGPSGDRPGGRGVPRRRHAGGTRCPVRDRLGQRDRGEPPGAGRPGFPCSAVNPKERPWLE